MTSLICNFANDESGATAIEYGLIVALIGVTLVAILGTVGTDLQNVFQLISNALGTAN